MLLGNRGIVSRAAHHLKETSQSRLPGPTVERIRRLLELHAVKEAFDVTGDRIGRHDQRRVQRMNIFAGDGASRVTDQRRDRGLRKPQVVGYTRKTMSKDMRRDIHQGRVPENLLPVIGETAE